MLGGCARHDTELTECKSPYRVVAEATRLPVGRRREVAQGLNREIEAEAQLTFEGHCNTKMQRENFPTSQKEKAALRRHDAAAAAWLRAVLPAFSNFDDPIWGPFSWVLDIIQDACISALNRSKEKAGDLATIFKPYTETIKPEKIEEEVSKRSEEAVRYIYYGFVIIVYAHLEHRLNYICEAFAPLLNLQVSLEEIHGHGQSIHRARAYMEKLLRFEVPTDSVEWDEVCILQALRNCIVHGDGRMKSDKHRTTLVRYAQNHPDRLSLDPQGRLFVLPAFPDWIIQQINNFLRLLRQLNEDRLQALRREIINRGR